MSGGVVQLSEGVFNMGATCPILTASITLQGAGKYATTLKARGAASPTVPALRIAAGADGVTIRSLGVNGNRAGGATDVAFYAPGNIDNLTIDDALFTNAGAFSAFLDTVSGTYDNAQLTRSIFEDSGGGWDTLGSGELSGGFIIGNTFRNSTGQGWACTNARGVTFALNNITNCGNGVSLEPGFHCKILGNRIWDLLSGTLGITVNHPGGVGFSDPEDITIEANQFWNTSSPTTKMHYAILLRNCLNSVVRGNTARFMGYEGVRVDAPGGVVGSGNASRGIDLIDNTVVDANAANAVNTSAYSLIAAGGGVVDDIWLSGNVGRRTYNTTTFSQWGLFISGATNVRVAQDNDFSRNVLGPISGAYLGKNSGATSVADGGTINHGLSAAPTKVRVTPSVAGEMASATAIGATTFTVALKTHAGAAGTPQPVYWEAES